MPLDLHLLIPVLLGGGFLAGLAIGISLRKGASAVRRGAVRIGPSTVSGRGAFAVKKIREGETVERCPALEVTQRDVGGELLNYVLYGSNENARLVVMGFGMLFNHSPEPNVAYYREESRNGPELVLYALRDIRRGEELFYNYGEEWWSTREG